MKLYAFLVFTLLVVVSCEKSGRNFNPLGGVTEIYSTGTDNFGNVLPAGSIDPHWVLSSLVNTGQSPADGTAYPSGLPTTFPQNLTVVNNQGFNGREQCLDCAWISPATAANTIFPGNYFYYFETQFQVSLQADLDTISLQLIISVADRVQAIYINGIDTSIAGPSDPNQNAFLLAGAFSQTSFSFVGTSYEFRHGTNTLEIAVEHAYGTPVAIAVDVDATSNFAPATPPANAVVCDEFNIYVPNTTLPAEYQDLSDILPNIVLDDTGKVTLPAPLSVNPFGYSTPIILSVQYSYYGEPICVTIVDCNVAGVGQIYPILFNTRRQQSVTFVADEVCSNPGVFFGCVDSAFGHKLDLIKQGPAGAIVTGEFADTLLVEYTDPYGLSATDYPIWLVCGNQPHWSFDLISGLMIQDALQRNIDKLTLLQKKVLQVQELLFNNAESIPCEEIGQATDLSQTALNFFNFLDCLGNRELSEDAFIYSQRLALEGTTRSI